MSRIGKSPATIPSGVEIKISAEEISAKGPLGVLARPLNALGSIRQDGDKLLCEPADASSAANAMSCTVRSLVNNMVTGVSTGFERKLTLVGVGYRAQAQGKKLNLQLGFSHPVEYQLPEGVTAETPSQAEVVITGIDKQLIGQVCAEIRAYRPPEPYKGKGVKYADEQIVRKEAKKK